MDGRPAFGLPCGGRPRTQAGHSQWVLATAPLLLRRAPGDTTARLIFCSHVCYIVNGFTNRIVRVLECVPYRRRSGQREVNRRTDSMGRLKGLSAQPRASAGCMPGHRPTSRPARDSRTSTRGSYLRAALARCACSPPTVSKTFSRRAGLTMFSNPTTPSTPAYLVRAAAPGAVGFEGPALVDVVPEELTQAPLFVNGLTRGSGYRLHQCHALKGTQESLN